MRAPDAPAGRPTRRRRGFTWAGRIALLVFTLFVAAGAIGAAVAMAAYVSLSRDLNDPKALEEIEFPEQSVVYDRTNKVQLARFGEFQRDVLAWKDIPPTLVDATTAVEDRTFWDNPGFDPIAIAAAALDTFRGNGRGASTITQQLVRQRLLDSDLVQDSGRTPERKLKEIIQSIRVTQAYPGIDGKQRIMAAYLNQNYYGNESYGVAAAARTYFGKAIKDLTLAQYAILAAIPQAPSTYDLVRNAEQECLEQAPDAEECTKSQLVVPDTAKIVVRRNLVLDLMAQDRTPLTKDQYTNADFQAAKAEKVVLAKQAESRWNAPHFVWQVRDELTRRLCGEDAETCPEIESGGFRIITTLDWRLQQLAERWVKAATIVPGYGTRARREAAATALNFEYQDWMENLSKKDLGNGALVAMDYQTGELVAYVGSADYYAKPSKRMQPQFDVASKGFRQPGSAFKPIMYAIGIDDKRFAAGSMFMDVVTDFGGGYTPTDADRLERGPVRLRDALRFSLNIPAVKAVTVAGPERVFARSQEFGLRYASETLDAGASVALGVEEVHPVDLVGAYGTLANNGVRVPQTTILKVEDTNGGTVLQRANVSETGERVISPQAAYVVTDILAGNTVPTTNPFWGKFELSVGGQHRPATLKTGTNNDAKDLNAYGYIARPTQEGRAAGEYALAVGVWNGNSDNSLVSTAESPLFSIDVSTYVWQGFMRGASAKWAINDFQRPEGLVEKSVDPFTGVLALPGGRKVTELYLPDGPQPASVTADGSCGEAILRAASFEADHESWLKADRDWINRVKRGPGATGGPEKTRAVYFYDGRFTPYGKSWGPIANGPGCASPSPSTSLDPCASGALPSVDASGSVTPTLDPSAFASLCPSASVSASPSESPSESPSPSVDITPPPTPEPTPSPTPTPTPTPTPEPTPTPTPTDSPSPAEGGGGEVPPAP